MSLDLRPLRPAVNGLRRRIRALYLLHGVGRTAALLGGLLALSFAIDLFLEPPRAVRAVHGLVSLVVLGWGIRRFLVYPLGRPLPDEELALAVEARVPALQDRLVGALQWERILSDPDCGESRAFMEASAAEAAAAVRAVRAADLTESRTPRRSLALGAGVALGCLAGVAAWPEEAGTWARRSLLLLDEPWPQRTTLQVLGFDPARPAVVTIGDDLPVQVQVEGVVPAGGVVVHYRTLPGEEGRVDRDSRPMLQSAEDPRMFVFVFHEIPASFQFWVVGGDDNDGEPRFTVRALVPPAIQEVTARLTFPPETGLPPEERREGDLEVPAGTRVDLAVLATVPLAEAAFVHPPGTPPQPLVPGEDGRTVRVTAVVKESADWRVDMVGTDGAKSLAARNTRRFTATPDPRPEVRLLFPVSRVYAVPDGRVPVKVLSRDNYSLVRVGLDVIPGRGSEPIPIPLATWSPAAGAGMVRESLDYRMLDLSTLLAASSPEGDDRIEGAGDAVDAEVLLRASATDNGGSTAATDQVAIQITDAAEILRRLSQKQTRIRDDLDGIRRHLEKARDAAAKAVATLAGGELTPGDRDALRSPASLAGRATRESRTMVDNLGEVLSTYAWNRLVDNRVASERVVAITDEWLREDREDPATVFKPALWRRLAAAHRAREIEDRGILDALLEAIELSDRLQAGPARDLQEGLAALSAGSSGDPATAAAAAVKAADEALVLVREIEMRLRQWETMHEILEAFRALHEQEKSIRDYLLRTGDEKKGR